jgi:hypothetical protein
MMVKRAFLSDQAYRQRKVEAYASGNRQKFTKIIRMTLSGISTDIGGGGGGNSESVELLRKHTGVPSTKTDTTTEMHV